MKLFSTTKSRKKLASIIKIISIIALIILLVLLVLMVGSINELDFPLTSLLPNLFFILLIIFFISLINISNKIKKETFKKSDLKRSMIMLVLSILTFIVISPFNTMILDNHRTICIYETDQIKSEVTLYHTKNKMKNINEKYTQKSDTLKEAIEIENEYKKNCDSSAKLSFCEVVRDSKIVKLEFEYKNKDDYKNKLKIYEDDMNYDCEE